MSTEVLDAPVLADEKPDELIHQGNHFATRKLTFSEACLSWPALSGVQYEKLEKSILEAKGIRIPILCDREYRIIDGRHRYLIARKHGMPIPIMFLGEKDDPFLAAIDENMRNRQLKPDQLKSTAAGIWIATRISPSKGSEISKSRRKLGLPVIYRKMTSATTYEKLKVLASKFGVSTCSITKCVALSKVDPETFDLVRKGELKLPRVKRNLVGEGRVNVHLTHRRGSSSKTFDISDFDGICNYIREKMLAASSVSIGAPSVAKKD